MKLRKIVIDLTVIGIALLLFILWHQIFIEKKVQLTISRVKNDKVYLITTDKEYQFWEYLNQGAADMAAEVGIHYVWEAPPKRNVAQQMDIINQAVEAGAEAILIAADDPKKISGVVEDAKAKGVKIVYVDSPAYEEAITTLATDNYEAGVRAGEAMLENLYQMGIEKGSIGIVSIADKDNTRLRENGFRDVVSKDARFRILPIAETIQGDPEEAKTAAEMMIKENEDLVALYGTNEGTSLGVGYANQEYGNRFVGIGFDQTDIMMELLREGSFRAIVAQNPYTMGYLGVAQAVAAILGRDTGPEYIDTGVSVIQSEVGR